MKLPHEVIEEMAGPVMRVLDPHPSVDETLKPGARSDIKRVTCISCSGTFTAYVYPPPKCELCGIHFNEQLETKPGDTLAKVKARAARKALRKGKRK